MIFFKKFFFILLWSMLHDVIRVNIGAQKHRCQQFLLECFLIGVAWQREWHETRASRRQRLLVRRWHLYFVRFTANNKQYGLNNVENITKSKLITLCQVEIDQRWISTLLSVRVETIQSWLAKTCQQQLHQVALLFVFSTNDKKKQRERALKKIQKSEPCMLIIF